MRVNPLSARDPRQFLVQHDSGNARKAGPYRLDLRENLSA